MRRAELLYSALQNQNFLTATAIMVTAFYSFVTFGTAFRTIVFTLFVDGIFYGNDAQATRTGTFHLSYGCHNYFLRFHL
ncbi:hypothetical protein DSM107007_00720 [Nostoc sp. PCC 7120 = FACHB-418]|nr:hypothetical protein DSM107007_00720 [Nostoc sp. PCC 7120 = FACHB-418]BAB74965.1 asr3266 [Nostoc sp. PCC 7120 = FACHB-418]